MVLCSLFENPVTPVMVYEDNQGDIVLAVSPKMRSCTNHISVKYHHLWSFVANGDVRIKHVNTKEKNGGYFCKAARF